MTPHVDPAGLAQAGQQLARVDAVLSSTGEARHLEIGLGVAVKHALPTEPVPPLHVAHRSLTGISAISRPSMPTALRDENPVDAGRVASAAHAVLPGHGGAS